MIFKTASIFRRLSRASFVIGSLCLILGLVLSFLNVPANAAPDSTGILDQVDDFQPNACTSGFKCEQHGCEPDPYSSWDAPPGYLICKITIKAGSHYLPFTSNGCVDVNGDGQDDYCVGGIGGGTGYAQRLCVGKGQEQCYAISYSEYFIDLLPPLPTATNTSVPPTPTSTDTSIPPSQTPTDTSVPPSQTPTDTSVPPSATPTNTSTALPTSTPTNTSIPATATPTTTNTPVPPTETQTGTPTNTSTPTGTPFADTTTPTVTGTQPTATITDTPVPATATPSLTTTSTQTSTATPTSTGTGTQLATATGTSTNTATPTSSLILTSTSASTGTQTQPPTLPPPQTTTTPALIPVTGADLSALGGQVSMLARMLINLGIGMIGLALVFYGLGKRLGSR